jgi:hypothetical protein
MAPPSSVGRRHGTLFLLLFTAGIAALYTHTVLLKTSTSAWYDERGAPSTFVALASSKATRQKVSLTPANQRFAPCLIPSLSSAWVCLRRPSEW